MRLIDADALLDKCYYAYPSIDHYCTSRSVVDAQDIINAPAIDAEPVRHGHWVAKNVMVRTPFAKNHYCSKCKFETHFCGNYCPNCGARMDGVRESDE